MCRGGGSRQPGLRRESICLTAALLPARDPRGLSWIRRLARAGSDAASCNSITPHRQRKYGYWRDRTCVRSTGCPPGTCNTPPSCCERRERRQ